jgi:16S rRNA processing protein RimM
MRSLDSSQPDQHTVAVGRIVKAHGLGGEVRVESMSDIPGRFAQLDIVYLRPPRGEGRFVRITGLREHTGKHQLLLQLEGVADRTAAEKLRGATLCIRPEDSPPLPEGQFYEHQIIGLEVVTTAGRSLGPVTEIHRTGANDVYATRVCLIPAIPDVIKEIDLSAGRILIEAIPGLLPEDDESGASRRPGGG